MVVPGEEQDGIPPDTQAAATSTCIVTMPSPFPARDEMSQALPIPWPIKQP